MYAGIAAIVHGDTIDVGLSANDATYSLDFTVRHLDVASSSQEERSQMVADWIIETMQQYQNDHLWCAVLQTMLYIPTVHVLIKSSTFLGAGLTDTLFHEISPELPSRIWLELDVVPMVFKIGKDYQIIEDHRAQRVDDQADSVARKTIMLAQGIS